MSRKGFINSIQRAVTKAVVPVAAIVCLVLSVQCRRPAASVAEQIPPAPVYTQQSQWYVTDREGRADVFYIISTETGDYTLDGTSYHHADTYNDSLRAPLRSEMVGVDTLISGKLNFFSPYYRQCSLQSFENDSIAQVRMQVAVGDVKKAFAYYLEHLNNGRPFILAGFSQGAAIALELMKDFDDKTYGRMIAAYIIGSSITEEQLASCTRIVPAQRADDLGVTICYNSVADPSAEVPGISGGNCVAINPVNWRTDSLEASFTTEPTPLLPIDRQQRQKLSVRLDASSRLLIVKGYQSDDYLLPLIGKTGNYHSREIWLYRRQLEENIALRTERYFTQKAGTKATR